MRPPSRPDAAGLTRAQILLHAAHQFVEGDVLHWWHPPHGPRHPHALLRRSALAAVRHRPLRARPPATPASSTSRRLRHRARARGRRGRGLPRARRAADDGADVYEHCCRALDRSLTSGAHGLPLMGTGDWNDGMNRVGREGRGESVWLAFFLRHSRSTTSCRSASGAATTRAWQRYRAYQTSACAPRSSTAAWDGDWYRRAYYDDGTPLGSAANDECRIDALAQAWAVLSGAAPRARAAQAMDAVERLLVDEDARPRSGCSRRRSTATRTIPATSRATSPASARTAASTRTPRSGSSRRSPSSAAATAPPRCSRC